VAKYVPRFSPGGGGGGGDADTCWLGASKEWPTGLREAVTRFLERLPDSPPLPPRGDESGAGSRAEGVERGRASRP
jgi:hypothetical protein